MFLLLGGDSLAEFRQWREPQRICELALPLIVRRHGSPEPRYELLADLLSPERLLLLRNSSVAMPIIEFSATDLRERARAGQSLRYRTPRAVEKFIEAAGLYRE